MEIKILKSFATSSATYKVGDVVEVESVMAEKWIATGHAEATKPKRTRKAASETEE